MDGLLREYLPILIFLAIAIVTFVGVGSCNTTDEVTTCTLPSDTGTVDLDALVRVVSLGTDNRQTEVRGRERQRPVIGGANALEHDREAAGVLERLGVLDELERGDRLWAVCQVQRRFWNAGEGTRSRLEIIAHHVEPIPIPEEAEAEAAKT